MEPSRQMTAERIWQWYCRSDDNRRTSGAYENARLAHRFYQGDQWRGVDAEGQNLPFYNFIQPIVDHKTAAVAMNTMTISFWRLRQGRARLWADVWTPIPGSGEAVKPSCFP